MNKLAILSTHPIQYNAPLFRMLADVPDIDLRVYYSKASEEVLYDPDFESEVIWDIPLTEGYNHQTIPAHSRSGRRSLVHELRRFNPRAILVYGWNPSGHLYAIRKMSGNTPIWFRGDSTLLDSTPKWKSLTRKIWLTWVYNHINLAFSVGKANTAYFKVHGLSDNQIVLARHTVDNARFQDPHGDIEAQALQLRKQWGIPQNEHVVLFAGKMEPKKQPHFLVNAWLKLPNPRPYLVLAGTGPLLADLNNSLGQQDRIVFTGFINQSQMPALYRTCNVFCLPSKGPGETWGLSVNEALASNKICLVSDRCGCHADFSRLSSVTVLPHDDQEAWTNSLQQISKNLDLSSNDVFLETWNLESVVTTLVQNLRKHDI